MFLILILKIHFLRKLKSEKVIKEKKNKLNNIYDMIFFTDIYTLLILGTKIIKKQRF